MRAIESSRVIDEAPRIAKLSQLSLLDEWRSTGHLNFRKKLRVEPHIFDGLVQLVHDHHIFMNNSNNPQLSVHIQLAIFLYRAGHYGNSAAPGEVAQWAGVSLGTVVNCTRRVTVAILSLHDDAIHLPSEEEKERAKAWIESETCPEWWDRWMLADGTKFLLFQRPGLHGDAWFDKIRTILLMRR
ncbi:hypothetical protein GGX14DRAFT_344159 [Mycena pura]|uniref:Uncharacterized protein n=1 Tax=Mycena pura TaxID=153505 RepID=A0AAD7E6R1_9AGAR|nr:hypothetical protein GGX14DRAFT_344159 [Mycena pura]